MTAVSTFGCTSTNGRVVGSVAATAGSVAGLVVGPVVGAFFIIALENYLAPFGQWVLVIQGAIFVFCVLVFRRGIVGELAYWLRVQL